MTSPDPTPDPDPNRFGQRHRDLLPAVRDFLAGLEADRVRAAGKRATRQSKRRPK